MYDTVEDSYCFPGTTVLKNLADLRNQDALILFETAMTAQRADEPLPTGKLSVRHYQAVHRHLFQDVYAWAGKFRTVRIAKNDSMFCYPENIQREMRILFTQLRERHCLRGFSRKEFTQGAASFLQLSTPFIPSAMAMAAFNLLSLHSSPCRRDTRWFSRASIRSPFSRR